MGVLGVGAEAVNVVNAIKTGAAIVAGANAIGSGVDLVNKLQQHTARASETLETDTVANEQVSNGSYTFKDFAAQIAGKKQNIVQANVSNAGSINGNDTIVIQYVVPIAEYVPPLKNQWLKFGYNCHLYDDEFSLINHIKPNAGGYMYMQATPVISTRPSYWFGKFAEQLASGVHYYATYADLVAAGGASPKIDDDGDMNFCGEKVATWDGEKWDKVV